MLTTGGSKIGINLKKHLLIGMVIEMYSKEATETFSIELKNGSENFDEYSADVTFKIWLDMYGEDVDGNRGELRTYWEPVEIDNVAVNDEPKDSVSEEIQEKIFGEFEPRYSYHDY